MFRHNQSVCIWSYLPGRFNGGFVPGQGVTTLSFNNTFPTYHPQNVWTLADDVFLTRGKHAFKLGILMNNYQDSSQMQKERMGTELGEQHHQLDDRQDHKLLERDSGSGFSTNGVLNPRTKAAIWTDLTCLRRLGSTPGRLSRHFARDAQPWVAL